MGEAARRKAREKAWRDGLRPDEKIVVTVAEKLFPLLPGAGACYRASLFLKYHLEHAHGLHGEAVVGFVNDGTDRLYSSHAWFMFAGKVTDLAISRPLNPEVQKAGPLMIHGHVVRPGWQGWTYHLSRPPEAVVEIQKLLADPVFGKRVQEAEFEHLRMSATAKNDALIRAYLDGAPDRLTYEVIAARL